MALGKGIPVINGFDLNSKLPLDSRSVADTLEEMNKLVTDGSVGDGQLCYCKADKKLYKLSDNVWSEVGGGGSVSPTLWLIDVNGEVRTTITEKEYNNLINGLYNQVVYSTNDEPASVYAPSKMFGNDGSYGFIQFKIINTGETFSYSSLILRGITIGAKNASNEYPITIKDELIINPPSASSGGGLTKIQCTRKDYKDLTKGGTVDTSTLPTDVPFILEVGMDGEQSGNVTYYGKLEFLMSYYSYNDHNGSSKKTWFGYANDNSNYYTAYIIDGEDVVFSQYVNTNSKIIDIELPTKDKPITSTTSFTITDITSGVLTIQNHYDIYLFGSLFNKYRSPVYSDTNGTLYYYILDYDLDDVSSLAMGYIEIPTPTSTTTTTITFED